MTTRAWRTGERVVADISGAHGTVTAVRRTYIMVTWDALARKRYPHLPERTKLGHNNTLRRIA